MHRRPGRRPTVLVAGIVAACAVGWVATRGGIGSPGAEPAAAAEPAAPSATVPAAGPTADDVAATPSGAAAWQRLIGDLYRRRAEAFATASAAQLGDVYTAASPQLVADYHGVADLLAGHRVVRGFAPRVDRVTAVTVSGDRTTVALVDSWPAYSVVDGAGRTMATVAARAPTGVRMILLRTAAGWRIGTADRLG
jgi:hypothetical protein